MSFQSARVGNWLVSLSEFSITVIAENLHSGEQWKTNLILFPVGYRVGKLWTNGLGNWEPSAAGIPKAVVSKANALARKLTA